MAITLIDGSWFDGVWNKPIQTGKPRRWFPFDGDNDTFCIEQDYMMHVNYFKPTPLNAPHETIKSCILVFEGPHDSLGSGVIKWTRIYSIVPRTRSEYESFVYEFPAFQPCTSAEVGCTYETGRDVYTTTVNSRVQFDYYVAGQSVNGTTAGVIGSGADIPIIEAQKYLTTTGPFPVPGKILNNLTIPTKTDYIALVNAGTEIVAEDSTVSRWKGNIWERKTRYVKAK